MTDRRPDPGEILVPLKDFQRRTAEYVFDRLYTDDDPTRRFLIADEAGLGKTLVAKGVVGQAIDHLWDEVGRIDVVYVCSNASIARQNVERLVISEERDHTFPSRITLLPQYVDQLEGNKVNFVSFTPGTSFDLKSTLGRMAERVLLYHLLREPWQLEGAAPKNVLQGRASHDRFRWAVRNFDEQIEPSLAAAFVEALGNRPELREAFEELCAAYPRYDSIVSEATRRKRRWLVGQLREVLANVCVEALEPDLIILDEFQRFKHLLDPDSSESELAQQLFEYSDENSAARVLLLSATPYKMYTLAHEYDEHHLEDFLRTLAFLADEATVEKTRELLDEYREALYRHARNQPSDVADLKAAIEAELGQVMARTERLTATQTSDAMLEEIRGRTLPLERSEIRSYLELENLNELLEGPRVMEYWKSAPYLLGFMNSYSIKETFREQLRDDGLSSILERRLDRAQHLFLSTEALESYASVDPRNARLRSLLEDVLETGVWQCLWLPPSLPYYAPGPPFDAPELEDVTKRLVFSSWRVVPKTIAAMVSYEVERRIMAQHDPGARYAEGRQTRGYLLRIADDDGRLTGMPLFTLLYPSPTLAELGDPQLRGRPGNGDELPTLAEMRQDVASAIDERLAPIVERELHANGIVDSRETTDERWYWLAPVLLDLETEPETTRAWLERGDLATAWTSGGEDDPSDDEFTHWPRHVERLREGAAGELDLGSPPDDLTDVLADVAIGAPATSALRALSRVVDTESEGVDGAIRLRAAQTGWAFRNLFNLPETTSLVRGLYPAEPYWRRLLEYCCAGNLQSVLDEWVHMLDDFGLHDAEAATVLEVISEQLIDALSLRTATVNLDDLDEDGGELALRSKRLRCHFALQFGQVRDLDTDDVIRADQVRRAFNSPLWPIVLATTSVGQEGLDFHPYCHAVVHWNLPSNPVDLEQRDGRVHRFKGHAIRKNVARAFGNTLEVGDRGIDVWRAMFEAAEAARDSGTSELVPYWVFANGSGVNSAIERYVPLFALSREEGHLDDLRRSLVLYRMAFGQSRQEDLVAYLGEHLDQAAVHERLGELQIDLSPSQHSGS